MSQFGIGIIGAGGIAHAHAQAYVNVEEAALIAVSDVNPGAAAGAAEKYGVDALSLEELLADRRIQVVSICTPPTSHASLTIAALDAGKHVLVEKPVATTVEDAADMMEAVKRSDGLKAMVAHSHRYWAANRKAKEILDSGKIGDVVLVRDEIISSATVDPENLPWRYKRAIAGGGVVIDNGVHAVDRLRYWLGADVTRVDAQMWQVVEGADVEDAAVATLRFESRQGNVSLQSGISAQLYLNRAAAKASGRCLAEFQGTKGTLVVETWGGVRWCVGEGDWNEEPLGQAPTAFESEIRAFLHSIAQDEPVPISLADGAESLRVVLALYESAERGEPISLT